MAKKQCEKHISCCSHYCAMPFVSRVVLCPVLFWLYHFGNLERSIYIYMLPGCFPAMGQFAVCQSDIDKIDWYKTTTKLNKARTLCVFLAVYCRKPLNTLRPRQNGRHFEDDILNCFFFQDVWEWLRKLAVMRWSFGNISYLFLKKLEAFHYPN